MSSVGWVENGNNLGKLLFTSHFFPGLSFSSECVRLDDDVINQSKERLPVGGAYQCSSTHLLFFCVGTVSAMTLLACVCKCLCSYPAISLSRCAPLYAHGECLRLFIHAPCLIGDFVYFVVLVAFFKNDNFLYFARCFLRSVECAWWVDCFKILATSPTVNHERT